MDNIITFFIAVPFIAGLLCLFIKRPAFYLKEAISLLISIGMFVFAIGLFGFSLAIKTSGYATELFWIDSLSKFMFLCITFFTLAIIVYSIGFMKKAPKLNQFYGYILLTMSASIGAVFSNNIILFIVFWGFLAIMLYLLIGLGEHPDTAEFAKKSLIMVGGSDSLLILGSVILIFLSKSFFFSEMKIPLFSTTAILGFFCLLSAAFVKAGVFPVHTWIPDIAESAPVPALAFFPASLDKLLGIYLFARIYLDIFMFNPDIQIIICFFGSLTIIIAVLMALNQHNMKKLLSYHAVSQVGYMVLGIASATPIGIIGGLFHMLNNALYKTGLFFGAGSVEKQTKTDHMDKLGGLAKYMPVTFFSFLFAALAISGVPPFNGFFSKWFIYQGLITEAKNNPSFVLWIVAAMFGSALTLASFLKIIHSVFLGHSKQEKVKDSSLWMLVPMVVISIICLLFGVLWWIPVRTFLLPIIHTRLGIMTILGGISLNLGIMLIIIALIIGLILYLFMTGKTFRKVPSFIGGEQVNPDMEMSGTEFYRTIEETDFFAPLYRFAKKKYFDIYDIVKSIIEYFGNILKKVQSGVLNTYITWILFGVIVLFLLFFGV
ncbi:MAG: hypothetical protein M1135_03320 [Candidatus Omnitrophica bacterium]|jgi:multicomponent Na+:H+ antiporter subunit A|nr:hypothetical protein [Candidatus Omnitrophota bacterium]